MEDLSQKIINIIKDKKIKPKSRWQFLLRDYFVWFLFTISVVIGALATSVVLFMIKTQGHLLILPNLGLIRKLSVALPYFWLIILIIFMAVAYYNFKHTKTGYRYNTCLIVVLSIVFSLALGALIFIFGMAEKFEELTYNHLPIYHNLSDHRIRMLIRPHEGILAGWVVEGSVSEGFNLLDFSGEDWLVKCSQAFDSVCCDCFTPDSKVVILGEVVAEKEFQAQLIRPFYGRKSLMPMMKGNLGPSRIIK